MAAPEEPGVRPTAWLLVQGSAADGKRFPLLGDETLIGRGPATNVTLSEEGVSREHALLSFDEATGVWTLEDLQSTNGTRVNGKRIRSAPLAPGDELVVGRVRMRFLVE